VKNRAFILIFTFTVWGVFVWPSAAAPGDLDPTFDSGSGIDSAVYGIAVPPSSQQNDYLIDVIQPQCAIFSNAKVAATLNDAG
jgi:hypothetical protein